MSSIKELARQRERRKRNNNADTKKYERTKKGKLMRTYRNMESRTKGIVHKGQHLYSDLQILPRQSFYDWSLSDEGFNRIFGEWVKAGYDRKLSPSIDRIDTKGGYTEGNIRWVTHSENSRSGGKWSPRNE